MKYYWVYLFFICSLGKTFAQEKLKITAQDTLLLHADRFIHQDKFGAFYYVKNQTLTKQTPQKKIEYNNILLGNLSHIDILNPLEITLFYNDFNTCVQLDNTLNEINQINFNTLIQFKNISWCATASNKRLWLYNTDNLQLELYNYQTEKTEIQTNPITQTIQGFSSNYNYCWVLTTTALLQYNVYGSLIKRIPFEKGEKFCQSKGNVIVLKNNRLFLLKNESSQFIEIEYSKLPIKDFSLSQESLYIYDGEKIITYKLPLDKP